MHLPTQQLNRRRFLLRSSIAAAAGLAAHPTLPALAGPNKEQSSRGSMDHWEDVRRQFALAPDRVHLSSFYLASHPRPVREAIARYREMLDADPYHAIHEGCWGEGEGNLTRRVKRAAAEYIGGRAEDVTLTQSTTMGLSLVYWGISLRSGDEILTTTHDHRSHDEAIRLAARRSGATVRKISLYDRLEDLPAITERAIVERVERAVTPSTRAVGLTWVHSSSGLRLPMRAIAAAIRQRAPKALIVLDGVHGFGAVDETIAGMGIDIFVAGTHKWIFGPRGTGIVWAPEQVWAGLEPFIPTFDGEEPRAAWKAGRAPRPPARADWFTPGGFHAFEHEWAVADAFAFHHSLGRKRVAERITFLNTKMKDGLARMPHVQLWTPRDPALSAGLVGFDVAGHTADETTNRLWEQKIVATSSPYSRAVARLSAGIMNNEQDLDKALRAVEKLGRSA